MKIRQNVYDINDDTLLWYSKAVEEMKKRDISDPSSWWYQAAVHGYDGNAQYWGGAPGFPPSEETQNSGYWDRCQHATWYFLPWHRMYLYYFERIVAKTIRDLGGPADWALPYWNYCDAYNSDISPDAQAQALVIPAEFGSASGDANPDFPGLWIHGRRNYILDKNNVNPKLAMEEVEFINEIDDIGFGGGKTGFSHFGRQTGQLESVPHNVVHSNIGGAMGNPNEAALDPIFWLHHANIDRLWNNWLNQAERSNPDDSHWLEFRFKFHDENNQPVDMAVNEVLTTQQLGYQYTAGFPASSVVSRKKPVRPMDVVGASRSKLRLSNQETELNLDMVPSKFRNASLKAAAHEEKKRTVLRISNVTGKGIAAPINIFVTNRAGEVCSDENFVGSIGLFGLQNASTPSLESDGSGLSFAMDISDLIDVLRQRYDWDEEQIAIRLAPQFSNEDDVEVDIGRVSVHSEID